MCSCANAGTISMARFCHNFIRAFVLLLLFSVVSHAATLYVSPSGSGSTCSDANRCSLATGLSAMSGGDTLILGDGTYTTAIKNVPSGSEGDYTTVKAENDWGATIDGSEWDNSYNHGIYLYANSYVVVQGIHVVMSQSSDTNTPISVSGGWSDEDTTSSHHNKIIRCSAAYSGTFGNGASISIARTSDSLVEECYTYGGSRYQFQSYWNKRVIFRRNVARFDYWDSSLQCALFNNYDSEDTVWQNNIAIDSPASNAVSGSGLYGGFFFENKDETTTGSAIDTSQIIYGNIILNVENVVYTDGFTDNKLSGTHTFTNNVVWDGGSGLGISSNFYSAASDIAPIATISGLTSGGHSGNYSPDNGWNAGGTGVAVKDQTTDVTNTVRNSLFYGNAEYGIGGVVDSEYNAFYDNDSGATSGVSIGSSSLTATDPASSGFAYLPRIEAGSILKTAGENGDQIGAEIMYQMGVSGTLYGEEGWDTLTTNPLWPFPNQDIIKADMASYSGPGASGARGFATGTSIDGSAQTLTKYIWEYLGTQIPDDLYDGSEYSGDDGTSSGDVVASSTGEVYYVRSDGSDSNDGLSNSSSGAFATIQKCADTVSAGDTCRVHGGDYAGFYVETTGTIDLPILFIADGTVNITSRNTRTPDGINIESWNGTPASYIIIDGFVVYNQSRMGIRVIDGSGVVVRNNTTHSNGDCGIFSSNSEDMLVEGNISHSNGSTILQHNIYLSNYGSDGVVIRGNTVYNAGGGNGIQLNGDWQEGGDGFIDNFIIENNVVYGNHAKGLSLISVRYGTVQNNIIYDNGPSAGGIHIVEQLGSHYSVDNVVVNNTIDETAIVAVRINSGNTGNIVFNNVAIGSIAFEGSGNYQSNNYTGTDGFADRDNHDYALVSGADAIDAGISTYQSQDAPDVDFLDQARDNSVDIGAYEFGASASVPISAPSNLEAVTTL